MPKQLMRQIKYHFGFCYIPIDSELVGVSYSFLCDYPAAAAIISTGECGIWYVYLPFFVNHFLILMHANMLSY